MESLDTRNVADRLSSEASFEAKGAKSPAIEPAVTGNEGEATYETNARALVDLLNEIALGQYTRALVHQGYDTLTKVIFLHC